MWVSILQLIFLTMDLVFFQCIYLVYFSWCLCVFIFRAARFICQISPRPQVIPGRYISRSVARIGSRVVAVVIWANIQHLSREIFVARSNNSIPRGPLPQPLAPAPSTLPARQWNYEWCDTFAIEMFSQSRGPWHAPAISYLLYLHRLRDWKLATRLAAGWFLVAS